MPIRVGDKVTDDETGFSGTVIAVDLVTVRSDKLSRGGVWTSQNVTFDTKRLRITRAQIVPLTPIPPAPAKKKRLKRE